MCVQLLKLQLRNVLTPLQFPPASAATTGSKHGVFVLVQGMATPSRCAVCKRAVVRQNIQIVPTCESCSTTLCSMECLRVHVPRCRFRSESRESASSFPPDAEDIDGYTCRHHEGSCVKNVVVRFGRGALFAHGVTSLMALLKCVMKRSFRGFLQQLASPDSLRFSASVGSMCGAYVGLRCGVTRLSGGRDDYVTRGCCGSAAALCVLMDPSWKSRSSLSVYLLCQAMYGVRSPLLLHLAEVQLV